MRTISRLEYRARQLILRAVMPACLEAANRVRRLAEPRFRRSFALGRHVQGAGIEVGAAAAPAVVPFGVSVTYVDRQGVEAFESDPELRHLPVRPPDVIADAETLTGIESDSQNFVLAFSVLEHVQDVLGSLAAFHRVTKNGGGLVVSVPDKRFYKPDSARPLTSFAHNVRDYREGPAWSLADHFREVGMLQLGLCGAVLDDYVDRQIRAGANAHFHVWNSESFCTSCSRGEKSPAPTTKLSNSRRTATRRWRCSKCARAPAPDELMSSVLIRVLHSPFNSRPAESNGVVST